MGKGGRELWDDSALIKAFDSAISNYKVIHGVSNSTHAETDSHTLPTNECVKDVSGSGSQVLENATTELCSSSNSLNGSLPPNNATADVQSGQLDNQVVLSDVNGENEYNWNPNDQQEYNQLWTKYYEVEDQRNKIIQQLSQYGGDWNYQTYDTNTHLSQEHKRCISQSYETVTCHCPYGCQNFVLPCTTVPDSCLGGKCNDKDCTVISEGVRGGSGTSLAKEDPDIVKTAMDAAERALSSLMKEDYSRADTSANGGKDNELGVERDHVTDSVNSATDISMVLKAWYSAGFYTGKYLSEQSFEKKTSR